MAGESLRIPALASRLSAHWRWSRPDKVCDGVFDCPHSTPDLTEDGPYVARSQDIRSGVFRAEAAARVSEDTYLAVCRRERGLRQA